MPLRARAAGRQKTPTTPDEALAMLKQGNINFVTSKPKNLHHTIEDLRSLQKGQSPFAVVLACSDSRVAVDILFDQGFGDVFECRVAGNIATTEEIGSIEYAVEHLGARVVVVMGHSGCGAIAAALTREKHSGFLDALVSNMEVAIIRALDSGLLNDPDEVSRINAVAQANRIRRSSVISKKEVEKAVKVVPAFLKLSTGQIEFLEYTPLTFLP